MTDTMRLDVERSPDVDVTCRGSLVRVTPLTRDARLWLSTKTGDDTQWLSGALVVEPSHIDELVARMRRGGLEVQ